MEHRISYKKERTDKEQLKEELREYANMLVAVSYTHLYSEGVAVMLFYQIGELFQSYAVGKSRRNISELMDIRPDYALSLIHI